LAQAVPLEHWLVLQTNIAEPVNKLKVVSVEVVALTFFSILTYIQSITL
jgi:hypothetical protein